MKDPRIRYAECFDGRREHIVGLINHNGAPEPQFELSSMADGLPVKHELVGVEYYPRRMQEREHWFRPGMRFGMHMNCRSTIIRDPKDIT